MSSVIYMLAAEAIASPDSNPKYIGVRVPHAGSASCERPGQTLRTRRDTSDGPSWRAIMGGRGAKINSF